MHIEAQFRPTDVDDIIEALTEPTSLCRLEALSMKNETINEDIPRNVSWKATSALTDYYNGGLDETSTVMRDARKALQACSPPRDHLLPTLKELHLDIRDPNVLAQYDINLQHRFAVVASQRFSPLRALTVHNWTAENLATVVAQLNVLTIKNISFECNGDNGFAFQMQHLVSTLSASRSIVELNVSKFLSNLASISAPEILRFDELQATLVTRMAYHPSLTELHISMIDHPTAFNRTTLDALYHALTNAHCTLQVLTCLCEETMETTSLRLLDALAANRSLTRVNFDHFIASVNDLVPLLRANSTLTSLAISCRQQPSCKPYTRCGTKLTETLRCNRSLTEFLYKGPQIHKFRAAFVDATYDSGNRTLTALDNTIGLNEIVEVKARTIKVFLSHFFILAAVALSFDFKFCLRACVLHGSVVLL